MSRESLFEFIRRLIWLMLLTITSCDSLSNSALPKSKEDEPDILTSSGQLDVEYKNLYAYFRADSLELSNSKRIKQWLDRSAHGRHLSAPEMPETLRPTLIFDSTINHMAVRFDGDDHMISTSEVFGTLAGPKTFFTVLLVRNATDGYVYDGTELSGRNTLHTGNGIYTGTWDLNSGALHGTTIGPKVSNEIWQIHAAQYDHKQNSHFINGEKVSIGDFTVYPLIGLTVGCRFSKDHFIDADIAEMIIYRDLLSSGQKGKLECYLSKRYGIKLEILD